MLFGGCSCNENNNGNNNDANSNITYTVIFYTGVPETFNVPNQEIKKGGLVKDPKIDNYYFDSHGNQYRLNGWYSDPSFDNQYLWLFATDEVHRNLTLYAKWELRVQN